MAVAREPFLPRFASTLLPVLLVLLMMAVVTFVKFATLLLAMVTTLLVLLPLAMVMLIIDTSIDTLNLKINAKRFEIIAECTNLVTSGVRVSSLLVSTLFALVLVVVAAVFLVLPVLVVLVVKVVLLLVLVLRGISVSESLSRGISRISIATFKISKSWKNIVAQARRTFLETLCSPFVLYPFWCLPSSSNSAAFSPASSRRLSS